MNAEFQRNMTDKKAFLNGHCKEVEENNRIGNTRGLCKKIRDTKETFHAKTGTRKDRNSADLTELLLDPYFLFFIVPIFA